MIIINSYGKISSIFQSDPIGVFIIIAAGAGERSEPEPVVYCTTIHPTL